MNPSHHLNTPDERPAFMALLGLNPPYASEDVHAAYLEKAKSAHPDRGGTVEQFTELQTAFDQARQYLEFRGDRRGWIAKAMEAYLKGRELIVALEAHGATVQTVAIDWLQHSFGDFAQLTESIEGVRLENSEHAAALLARMIADHKDFAKLIRLELPGCTLTDADVLELAAFPSLRVLDLSGMPITNAAMAVVDRLPALLTLNLDGTQVGWWKSRGLQSMLQTRRESKPVLPTY